MATVALEKVSNVGESLDRLFAHFGGVARALPPPSGTLYVKPNGVHFAPHTHTDPQFLEALLGYLRDHGHRRIAVMENSSGGNCTRLVFKITGYDRICRRFGARPAFLDEGRTVDVTLRDEDEPTRISRELHDQVVRRGDNLYLSVPKLKTHLMCKVTLGVKNQQAFPVHASRMRRHDAQTLDRRLAALYDLVRPDFCIVEGLTATAHGHLPPTALLDECLRRPGLILGGPDTLAVDAVGSQLLGYGVDEVAHLRLCHEWRLGQGDLSRIDVVGEAVRDHLLDLPWESLRRLHPGVRIVRGRERACLEGCRGNSECILQILTNDHACAGGWSLVFGKGFAPGDLDGLPGDILVVGPCAVREVWDELGRRYPDRQRYYVNEHNDLMANTHYQAKLGKVSPLKLVPINPLSALLTLLWARLHRLNARIPPIMGGLRQPARPNLQ